MNYPLTNIKEIDAQHQEILDTINQLSNGVREGLAESELLEIINRFGESLIVHFGTEEKYMMMSNYPDREEHFESHKDFLLTLILNKKKFYAQNEPIDLNDLSRQVASHINTQDKKLAAYLIKQHW